MLSSHVHGCFELYMCKMCTIILLMTSVWPSVWGWKAVNFVSLVSSINHKLYQNVLRNLLSQYEIIYYGIPKCTHTHSKKSVVVASTMIFFLQAAIMAIFENLSMTTNTQSLSCLVEGRPDM